MEYCKYCGTEVKEGAAFCGQCGKRLHEEDVRLKGSDKKLNQTFLNTTNYVKTHKWVVGIIAIIFSFIVFYQIGLSMTSQQHLVDQFEKAINEEDAKALSSLLYSPDSELEVNEETAKSLLDYFIKNPDQYEEVIWQLSSQVESNEEGTELSSTLAAFASSYSPLKITNIGKTGFVFDKHRIEVTPQYMNISNNLEGVKILVNDIPVETVNNEDSTYKLGPYLPGTYRIKAVYEGKYAKSEMEEERDLFSFDGEDYFDLDLNVDFLDISSNAGDARILINGSDTGLTVDDSNQLGPVTLDGTIKLQLEKDYPWGKVRSEEIQIDDSYIRLDIDPLNDNLKDTIMETINQNYLTKFIAIKSKDVTKLDGMREEDRKDAVSIIEELEQINKMLVTESKFTTFYDLESFYLRYKNGRYYISFNAGYILNGQYVSNEATEEQKQEALQNKFEYHFIYEMVFDEQENKWLINKKSSPWYPFYEDKKQFELSLN